MSYIINYSGGTITIPVNTADTTATPLTLIGRNWKSSNVQEGYGQALNQNFVSLLENFADSNQPINPLKGQFWYDTSTSEMKWNGGTPSLPNWIIAASSTTIPSSIAKGSSDVNIPITDGDINFTVGGVSNVVVVTSLGANIDGDLEVVNLSATDVNSANINSSNIVSTNANIGTITANIINSANINSSNVVSTNANIGTITATTLNVSSQITGDAVIANTFQSTVNDGVTSPMTVASSVKVDNLNADLLDGHSASNVRNTSNAIVVRNATTGVIDNDINGNITGGFGNISTVNAGAINSTGAVNFSVAPQVLLGSIANIRITGGTGGQVLSTDGTGILSWSTVDTTGISNGTSGVSIPTVNGNVNLASAGTNRLVITSTGANVLGTLNVSGTSNLGTVGNVTITGGTTGQILTTNGSGVLSWETTRLANGTSNVSIPTVDGNVNIVVAGTNRIVATTSGANVTGALGVLGNITGTNVSATGSIISTANITALGSINAGTLGTVNFTGASNVSLGDVSNVKITGGTSGQLLSTNGSGVLSWSSATNIGVNQTWQNVLSSRSIGVTYTNTTGKPIMIAVYRTGASYLVDGVTVFTSYNGSNERSLTTIIIPNNSTYRVNGGSTNSSQTWWELR